MEAFGTLTATALPIEASNVDTDQIIPARFLRYARDDGGYGQYLFHDLRRDADGAARPDFVLNQPAYRDARIIIANANFGCGSSREGAAFALVDHGFRCVIAPSFGDIFHQNCLMNGLLPVRLAAGDVAVLRRMATQDTTTLFTVDLPNQTVSAPGREPLRFAIGAFHKTCLLRGVDDISFTLEQRAAIDAFESAYLGQQPWLAAGKA
jgi:3-isopropylmalate/(R)-2-methylmalate dehydratase small subunit